MDVKTKILIHHHAVAYKEGERIWVQSFIASWVLALSNYFDQVGLLLNTSDNRLSKQDTSIEKSNVVLHSLGKVVKGKKVSKLNEVKTICHQIGGEYNNLVIRGITPQQMVVFENCPTPVKAFLLVGSIKDSKPKLSFHWLSLFIRFKYYQRIYQIQQIAKTSFIFANSPHIVSELNERLSIDAVFMPTNTISIDDFIPFQNKEIKSPPEILFCGRVVQDKGIEELIKALAILKNKSRIVRLIIVGGISDTYKKTLINTANTDGTKSQIQFEGFIPFGKALMNYYRKADLYVLPSWHEGFPHSIWEAAANCTPIITTKVGGIPGLMSNKEVFYIETKSPESIAEGVEKALANKELCDQKVEAVFEKAKEFTVEKCAEKIFNVLCPNQSILNG